MSWYSRGLGRTFALLEKIQDYYRSKVPYDYRPGQIWYYVKCRLWHKYNVVRCEKIGPTWIDRDNLLFHAMMQVMVDFVEGEKPYEWFNTEESHKKDKWDELRIIYNWYKLWPTQYTDQENAIYREIRKTPDKPEVVGWLEIGEKKCRVTKLPPLSKKKTKLYNELDSLKKRAKDDADMMMHRLIVIRDILWT